MASFDVKLIPEFDDTGDIVDWLEKVEMVCGLQQPAADVTIVIPLRLKGGAWSPMRPTEFARYGYQSVVRTNRRGRSDASPRA